MARSRNIKPSFFTNDELAELEPVARLFFIGLWTIADYQGNFEWRSKKLKAQLLPYDECDVIKIAINLDKSGFIRFYSDNAKIYANIVNFSKHQNPHKNEKEKGSEIPNLDEESRQVIDFTTLTINRDKNRINTYDSQTNPADSLNLIPDSLNLIPDSGNPAKEPEEPKAKTSAKANDPSVQVFEYWKVVMNKNDSSIFNKKRQAAVKARLKEGYSVDLIKTSIYGCSITPHNMGANENGTRYDDLELICRDGSHLERFAANANRSAPRPQNPRTNRTVTALKELELN